MADKPSVTEQENESIEFITVKYDGGRAAENALDLADYARSLAGLRELIGILAAIVQHNVPHGARYRSDQILRVEVRSEKPGSWDVVVALGISILGSTIYDLLKSGALWGLPRFVQLLQKVIESHIASKEATLDVDEIASRLEGLLSEYNLRLDLPDSRRIAEDEQMDLIPKIDGDESDDPDDAVPRSAIPGRRSAVDQVDRSLKEFAKPIGVSCTTMTVTSLTLGTSISFDASQKPLIDAPLMLMPRERTWRPAAVKFVRINRKTGRAIIFFMDDPAGEENTYYSIIVDPKVRRASNVYTEAFSKDAPLDVFVRHAPEERGRIRTLWEVTVEAPYATLFGYE